MDLRKEVPGGAQTGDQEEVITCRPADRLKPEMDRLTQEIGTLAQSTEDVLTYAMFPEVGRAFLQARATGTLTPEVLLAPPDDTRITTSNALLS